MPFPLSDEELRKTEKEIGAELPSSYRNGMMIDNGGFIKVRGEEWQLFPIRDQSSRKLITRTANHILEETKSAQEWAAYPENALAIAANDYGDLLVMLRTVKGFEPQVFLWSHEDGSIELVANDFSELKG
jgi:hypothetical protein